MRIDKFLKVSRIIKRRTVAKDITDAKRIIVNSKVVKPSYQVKIGDIITVLFGNKEISLEVKSLELSPKKEDAKDMYVIIDEKNVDAKNKK